MINLDNIDEYINRGFIDKTNTQQEEYMERADEILIKLQDESKDQEKAEEKRRKLYNHLKTLFPVFCMIFLTSCTILSHWPLLGAL